MQNFQVQNFCASGTTSQVFPSLQSAAVSHNMPWPPQFLVSSQTLLGNPPQSVSDVQAFLPAGNSRQVDLLGQAMP